MKSLIGREAQIKYYDNYKNLNKILCKKRVNGLSNLLPPI